ncbi:MAG: hypothetical protein LBL96_08420 [Clostridiales bacterium]|jgi:hypothetical protein|nr:hypothetical protein [Clostridiales bacterium]
MKYKRLTAMAAVALIFLHTWGNHALGDCAAAPIISLEDSESDDNIQNKTASYKGLEYDVKNKTLTVRDASVTLAGSSASRRIILKTGADVTMDGVYLENAIYAPLSAEGRAILRLTGQNILKGKGSDPALYVREGADLIITSNDKGSLEATAEGRAAAIGSSPGFGAGDITIKDALITATSRRGPAIGCANGNSSGDIVINNSDVFLRGGENSNAIAGGGAVNKGVLSIDKQSRVLAVATDRPAIDEALKPSSNTNSEQATIINCLIKSDIYDKISRAHLKSPNNRLMPPRQNTSEGFAAYRYFAATVTNKLGKLYLKTVFPDGSTLTLYESDIYNANGKADKDGVADGDRFQLAVAHDFGLSVIDGVTRTVEYVRLITLSDGTVKTETMGIFDYPDLIDHAPVEKSMAEAFDTGIESYLYDVSGWYASPQDETFSYRLNGEDEKTVPFKSDRDLVLYGKVSELQEAMAVDIEAINKAIKYSGNGDSNVAEQAKITPTISLTPYPTATPSVK